MPADSPGEAIASPGASVVPPALKGTLVLLLPIVLVTLHRYLGSADFGVRWLGLRPGRDATLFLFSSAFLLFGLVPAAVVRFVFREPWKAFGLCLGDWRAGIWGVVLLFALTALALLYPASQNAEIRALYPLDKAAYTSAAALLELELFRGALFYSAMEFFFRGFVLFGLRPYVGEWYAVCIQAIPYCLWHIGLPAGEIFASIPAAILFGLLAVRTRSVLWPFLLHLLIGATLDLLIVITP